MTTSDLPTFTMRQLLEAGVHFGHQTHRWNPKMAPYIYGERNQIHIMDLRESAPMLSRALLAIREVVSGGGRVLFVGTKRQASEPIKEKAMFCGQYYVNHRWLGGMLTNWKTISNSIKRLRSLEEQLSDESSTGLTKKEMLNLTRERDKLERALGGIKEMGGLPDILFVIDTVREEIALREARKLNIPVVGVCDSNSDPEDIDYPIPGNDDAGRAIALYLDLAARSVIAGLRREQQESGTDLGAAVETPLEELPADETPAESAGDAPTAEETSTEAAAQEAAAAEAAPVEETTVEKPAAEETVAEETAAEETAAEETVAEETAAEETAAEETAAEETAAEETVAEETAAEAPAPEEAATEEVVAEAAAEEAPAPEEAATEEAKPDDAAAPEAGPDTDQKKKDEK